MPWPCSSLVLGTTDGDGGACGTDPCGARSSRVRTSAASSSSCREPPLSGRAPVASAGERAIRTQPVPSAHRADPVFDRAEAARTTPGRPAARRDVCVRGVELDDRASLVDTWAVPRTTLFDSNPYLAHRLTRVLPV